MRKVIILCLIFVLILTQFLAVPVFSGTVPTVRVGNIEGKKGDIIDVPVVLKDNTGFSNLGIEIGYDETALLLRGVTATENVGATYTAAQTLSVNPYNMMWDSGTNVAFNGLLATLTFEIVTDKPGTYPVTVDFYKGRYGNYKDGDNVNFDADFKPLGLVYQNGGLTIGGSDEPDENAPTVTVGSIEGKKGDTVKVPVTLAKNTGFSNLGIEIGYDETALVLKDVVATANVGATYTAAQTLSVNPYNMMWDSGTNVAFNGLLATLNFEIVTDKPGTYPVTVDFYKGRYGNYKDGDNVNFDADFKPLGLVYQNGSVTVDKYDENAPTVTVGSIEGKKGDTVKVPVTLTKNTGFSNLGIEIGYDETALVLKDVVTTANVGATYTAAQTLSVNPYNMMWDSGTNVAFNGLLATLTFEIVTDKPGTYPVTVDFYKGRYGNYKDGDNVNFDADFKPLGLVYQNGSVMVDKYEENSITLTKDLSVTLTGEFGKGRVYAAIYQSKTRLKQVVEYSPLKNFEVSFNSVQPGDIVKIMWVKDGLRPMCKAQSVVIP